MILQGVGHQISCLGVCYANDPEKGGYTTPAPALDLTTSLRGDFLCCGMLRHAAACFYLHMWVPTLLWGMELTCKRQHAQHFWAKLITFTIRIVCSGFVDIHHSQLAQSVVAHLPIRLNVRSTWQAERGRRTKKTAMLLNVGKSSFLACHHATLAAVESGRGLGAGRAIYRTHSDCGTWGMCLYNSE